MIDEFFVFDMTSFKILFVKYHETFTCYTTESTFFHHKDVMVNDRKW